MQETVLMSGLGRSLGEGNGNLLQYSCLESSMDRGAWQTTVWGRNRVGLSVVTKQQLHICIYYLLCAQSLSRVRFVAYPRTGAHQAPLPKKFSQQKYWSRSPCPPPGDLPNPGVEPTRVQQRCRCLLHLLHWQADSLPLTHQGNPYSLLSHP